MQSEMTQTELLMALRNGQLPAERSKEYWSESERTELKRRYLAGDGISEIALNLQRSENAVIQQLIAMGLLTPPGKQRRRNPKGQRCQCPHGAERNCPYYNKEGGTCCSNNSRMS